MKGYKISDQTVVVLEVNKEGFKVPYFPIFPLHLPCSDTTSSIAKSI